MRYPEFLKERGTIGFVAPSFGCNIEPYKTAFLHAQEKWKQMGYGLKIGENCYKGCGIGISNTPGACARELEESYCSDDSDILISCGGGELMCETIEQVDFGRIAEAKPKWYMGYSDNTNMTFLLTTLCDVASVYAPCASDFGMEPWHKSVEDAFALLKGERLEVDSYEAYETESLKGEENPLAPYHCTEPVQIKAFEYRKEDQGGAYRRTEERLTLQGRLIGGCMDCLVTLLGTKYDQVRDFTERYEKDGLLWFLEACDLNVFGIRRAMWQMENAGWFRHVKGFLIGRPLNGEESMGLDHLDAVLAVAARHEVPVIMDADLGHVSPAMPIICGSLVDITAEEGKLHLAMKLK